VSRSTLYRTDVKEAVRIFRPLLQDLNVRATPSSEPFYIASYDQLAFLNLDQCSIKVEVADIDVLGIFFFQRTKQGLLRAYIILSKYLYTSNTKIMKQIRKKAAIHEFIHFIAMIYVVTITSTTSLRTELLKKLEETLQKRVKKILGPNSESIVDALYNKKKIKYLPLTDAHFRLGYEGKTPDYDVLFLYFLFSRELFEEYFNQVEQANFKRLYTNRTTRNTAIQNLRNILNIAANDKDVSLEIAESQLSEWIYVYIH